MSDRSVVVAVMKRVSVVLTLAITCAVSYASDVIIKGPADVTKPGEWVWIQVGVPTPAMTNPKACIFGLTTQDPADTGPWTQRDYLCLEIDQNGPFENPGVPYRYDKTLQNSRIGWLVNQMVNPLTNAQGAGLQVAIWELLYDTGEDLTTGNFQLVSPTAANVYTEANAFLTNSQNQTASYYYYAHDTKQDLGTPVPEPATLLALLAGIPWLLKKRS